MNRKIITTLFCPIFIMALLSSCGSAKQVSGGKSTDKPVLKDERTFVVKSISEDATYGYTENNPIKVGGVGSGPLNEKRYLNALALSLIHI